MGVVVLLREKIYSVNKQREAKAVTNPPRMEFAVV